MPSSIQVYARSSTNHRGRAFAASFFSRKSGGCSSAPSSSRSARRHSTTKTCPRLCGSLSTRGRSTGARVEDIVNLLGHAARKLLECAAAPTEAPRAAPPSLLAVDGANATVSDTEADGLHLTELACAVDRPLLGTLAIIGALSKQASAFDRCAPRGDAAILHWSFEGGRPQDITVRGASSKKVDACLVAALNKIRAPFDARCGAVLHVGDEKGAREAHARLPTGE